MKMMDYLGFNPDVIEKFTDYCEKAMKDAGFTDEEIDNIMKEPVYDRMHEIINNGYGIKLTKGILPADVILNEIGSHTALALQVRFPEEKIAYFFSARSSEDNTLVINDVEYKPDKCDNIMSLFNGFYPDKNDNLMDMRREKAAQLAEYLDIDPYEIELPDEDEPNAKYKTPEGSFTVMTEDEADSEHKEYIRSFIDEYGIEGFTEGFRREIIRDCIDQDELEDYLNDTIHWEIDNMDDNEVAEKAEEMGLAWIGLYRECEENGDFEKCVELISDIRYELVDPMVENVKQAYNGIIADWIIDNFGNDELNHHIKNNQYLLDIDEISKRCVDCDGYGHSLARWDGKTNETADFYIFKQDKGDSRSNDFIANYLCVDNDEVMRLKNLKSQSAIDRD